MIFSGLQELVKGVAAGRNNDEEIKHISFDSRKNFPGAGAVFFCLKGPHHDGHQFAKEAYVKGWRLFVASQLPFTLADHGDASVFVTEEPLLVLQELAAKRRSSFAYPVIGITGSNGKTIVKEWLYQLTASNYSVVKSPKSFNSQVGVPLSVWNMSEHHNLGIFEAGISEPGEMEKLQKVIQPEWGIFTNMGSAHDASFDSSDQKLKEKLKLFINCRKLIYCTDHQVIHQELTVSPLYGVELVGWGKKGAAYNIEKKGEKIVVTSNSVRAEFPLPFSDPKSIENLCHSVVAALELSIPQDDIIAAIKGLKEVPMRMELRAGLHGSILVDDSYNNDLQGLDAALDFLKTHSHGKSLTVILSDFLQTRGNTEGFYGEVNKLLQTKGVSRLVAIGPKMIEQRGQFNLQTETFPDTNSFLDGVTPSDFAGQAVLIKGARYFGFEKIVQKLQAKIHRTVLEINLEALQHNFQYFRALLSPPAKTMVMLKAFAYGSGSGEIGRTLQYLKADYIAVAFPDEGVTLRQQGVQIPILVMNAPPDSFDLLKAYHLEPEIYSFNQLDELRYWSESSAGPFAVHIKLDTGMHRLGFVASEWQSLKHVIDQLPHIQIASIFSHLAASEKPEFDAFTHEQAQTFLSGYNMLASGLSHQPMKHLLNSAGISRFPTYHFDMVRIGIGLHGIEGSAKDAGKLKPVACLKTVVSQVKRLAPGQTIGYGRTATLQDSTTIATIAVGYADGYGRAFGHGRGKIAIKGKLYPTVGSICMDMTMIDVGESDVKEGDEVVVFGNQPTVAELASWSGTIPYEILTSVSDRVKRVYLSE